MKKFINVKCLLLLTKNCALVGISLRKVEKGQQREGEKGRMDALHDVASILARRVAMEISDSESGSDSGSGSDWDDETRYEMFTFFLSP